MIRGFLEAQSKLGFTYLRPIQVAFESPKFMLPIRLGMVNANGPQELFVYALTRRGRVETTNYRTVRLPSNAEIPLLVKNEFPGFYKSLFSQQVKRQDMRTVFLEYAWDMGWCDPCSADPLSADELRQLGIFWLDQEGGNPSGARNVFLTRLHLRYDAEHFPEDLSFQETADRENFQGRFILRHPWTGDERCAAAETYRRELPKRYEQEAQTLASLTAWDVNKIRRKMNLPAGSTPPAEVDPWWKKIWN